MVIDYAGLDSSVAQATLIENGFRKSAFMDSPGTGESEGAAAAGTSGVDSKGKPLERSSSISSSNAFATSANSGQNEFRRRSARKASFYSERAPRVGFCLCFYDIFSQ